MLKTPRFFQCEICDDKNLWRLRCLFLYFLCISFWAPKKKGKKKLSKFFTVDFLEKPAKIRR